MKIVTIVALAIALFAGNCLSYGVWETYYEDSCTAVSGNPLSYSPNCNLLTPGSSDEGCNPIPDGVYYKGNGTLCETAIKPFRSGYLLLRADRLVEQFGWTSYFEISPSAAGKNTSMIALHLIEQPQPGLYTVNFSCDYEKEIFSGFVCVNYGGFKCTEPFTLALEETKEIPSLTSQGENWRINASSSCAKSNGPTAPVSSEPVTAQPTSTSPVATSAPTASPIAASAPSKRASTASSVTFNSFFVFLAPFVGLLLPIYKTVN